MAVSTPCDIVSMPIVRPFVVGRGQPSASSVDVVAEEHDGVACLHLTPKLVEDVVEGRKVSVDVTDGDCGHLERLSSWRAAPAA
jgi:hypothetical protein